MASYEQMKEDLQKNMLITGVRGKLIQAKALLLKANEKFNNAIKNDSSRDLWFNAKNLNRCQDRYKMAVLLYYQVKKEGVQIWQRKKIVF